MKPDASIILTKNQTEILSSMIDKILKTPPNSELYTIFGQILVYNTGMCTLEVKLFSGDKLKKLYETWKSIDY